MTEAGKGGGLRPDQRLSNIYKLYRATRIGSRPGPDSLLIASQMDGCREVVCAENPSEVGIEHGKVGEVYHR